MFIYVTLDYEIKNINNLYPKLEDYGYFVSIKHSGTYEECFERMEKDLGMYGNSARCAVISDKWMDDPCRYFIEKAKAELLCAESAIFKK